jgi:hypothetical protein
MQKLWGWDKKSLSKEIINCIEMLRGGAVDKRVQCSLMLAQAAVLGGGYGAESP